MYIAMKIDLQVITKNDAASIYNSWGSNPDNFMYLRAVPQKSLQDAQVYLDKLLVGENLAFHIVDPSTKSIVGHIKAIIEEHKALVGYVIDQKYWGQGVASQALEKMLETLSAMPNIIRVWATCAVENAGSIRVLEKCGFEKEGLLKKWIVYQMQSDEPQDNFSFSYVFQNDK